jgi:hypothetical protein
MNPRHIANITIALASLTGLAACALPQQFSQAATDELADNVRTEAHRVGDATGEPANSYVVLRTALHTVVDLDDFDEEDYRPRHVGLTDDNADGVDDDGKIEIVVRTATTCIDASTTDLQTAPGRC